MLSWYATGENTSAPSELYCSGEPGRSYHKWHLPVAGSGKSLGPKSSDMFSGSECCNVLKSICQMWWATQFWNDLSPLFLWIYYRSSLFISLNLPRVPAWPHWFCTKGCLENIDALSKYETFFISYIKNIFKWQFVVSVPFCPVLYFLENPTPTKTLIYLKYN